MDSKVWDHLQTLTKDVATLAAQVEWLTWWVRALVVANGFTGLIGGTSLVMLIRNHRNSNRRSST